MELDTTPTGFDNRITRLLGIELPILQAPMGWIARARLAAAVSNAGGMGIIETSSGETQAIRREIESMRDLTDKPFGVNIAQAFLRDTSIFDVLVRRGVGFVTTSAGNPLTYAARLKAEGLTVFHVVPTLRGALKAVDAGVDGLIVEGGEGGGFKHSSPVASMVLVPLVAESVDVPIIAAGGIADGRTMAAALALGAEGVQMGTRMLSAAESPVHQRWKDAVVSASETDTVVLNRHASPALRALRTHRTASLEFCTDRNVMTEFGDVQALYFGGEMDAAIALCGQVAGRIREIEPVTDIVRGTARDCVHRLRDLSNSVARRPDDE